MSSIITKINSLHGKCVDRAFLQEMIILAKEQEQPLIIARLRKLLKDNPKEKEFKIKIAKPAIEVVPHSFLDCLECDDQIEHETGLGKAVTPDQVYQMMTDRMIQLVKEAGVKDYVQKWRKKAVATGYLIPFNFVSKKAYRGINRFLLTGFKPLENPFFLTFKQVEELGGTVRKGAHGHEVVYFTQLYKYEQAEPKLNLASYNRDIFISMLKANASKIKLSLSPELLASQSVLPILKYYNVFNGKDITGIDFDLKNFKTGYIEIEQPSAEQLPIAESIVKHYPETAPQINHGGQEAFYRPGTDKVQMPVVTDFDTIQDYYRTLFHELAHSTGHGDRLARKIRNKFGSKDYAFEELIAEFGAVFLSAEAGILWHTDKNHAAYLANWNSALTHLKEDNRFLMRAATQAQKLTDYILNLDKDGQPAYMADLKKVVEQPQPKRKKKPVKKENPNNDYLDQVNPPSYATKPKSTAVTAAINDILSTGNYPKIKPMQVGILFGLLKNVEDITQEDIGINPSNYQWIIIQGIPKNYAWVTEGTEYWPTTVSLQSDGQKLIMAIRNRLESLRNQKHNYSMFDGLKGDVQGLNGAIESEPVEVNDQSYEIAERPEPNLQYITEHYEPQPEPEPIQAKPVTKNPLLVSSKDLMNMQFESLEFDGAWAEFMQEPAKNMKIAIWGKPKNGKTSGACALAEYLTKYGNVLYNFADQGINKSTQDIWRNSGLEDNDRAFLTDANTLDDLEKLVADGSFDFVFIDMINHYIDHEKMKPHEFKERFIQKYPEVSFILVMEVTKSGNFKGDQGWTHIVDALVTVENFVMENRGRYGYGHYVVWKQGLKDNDPDRYEEIFGEETQEPTPLAAPALPPPTQKLKFTVS